MGKVLHTDIVKQCTMLGQLKTGLKYHIDSNLLAFMVHHFTLKYSLRNRKNSGISLFLSLFQADTRLWRKNRRWMPEHGCYGVDLNRNYDYHFASELTSHLYQYIYAQIRHFLTLIHDFKQNCSIALQALVVKTPSPVVKPSMVQAHFQRQKKESNLFPYTSLIFFSILR